MELAPQSRRSALLRLIVPYRGEPLALTPCPRCRPAETGEAVILTGLAKSIADGKARFEVTPARGKRPKAPLTP